MKSAVIVGGGPAGLMAAEVLIQQGVQVDVYDAMPSLGRKFLIAGRGGLNLTHSEPLEVFLSRYGAQRENIEPLLNAFGPQAVREWVHDLGYETFIGTSGRVFPAEMKAAPLLRVWLERLQTAGVRFHVRHRWLGWDEAGDLCFETPAGEKTLSADVLLLALGGGSWSKLGSDGAWVPLLAQKGVEIAPLLPANCGFDVGWSEHFRTRFAGAPLKSVVLTFVDSRGNVFVRQGEFVITENGVEGSLIYAASAWIRDTIIANGRAIINLDLLPNRTHDYLVKRLSQPRGSRSMSNHLRSRVNLKGVKVGLLYEFVPPTDFANPQNLAGAIKALRVPLLRPRPLDEAISSAGGVTFAELDDKLMLRKMPGVFCAGEMLDWEAPTGGYLLTACFASGRVAGHGMVEWIENIA